MIKALPLLFVLLLTGATLDRSYTIDSQTAVGSTTGAVVAFPPAQYSGLTAVLTWANTAGVSPTLNVKIQTCRTTSTSSCVDWPAGQIFAQKSTGSGVESIDISPAVNSWRYFRAVSTVAGTSSPTYTYTVELAAAR